MSYQARSILVINASAFARSLAMLPAIRALRDAYPNTFIAVAAARGTCQLVESSGLASETIDLGIIKNSKGGHGGAIKRLFRLANKTRQEDFDLILDLSPGLETQIVSRIRSRSHIIAPSKPHRVVDFLLGRRPGPLRPGDHFSDCANVLGQLGLKIHDRRLGLELPGEESRRFEQLLVRNRSQGGEPIIALYSSRAGSMRGWPIAYFAELAQRLVNNFGARIVVLDEPADRSFTNAIGGVLPSKVIKLAAPTALELGAAIARASLVVTDDQELGELALDFGTPILEIASEPPRPHTPEGHRVVSGVRRTDGATDEAYEVACEMLQESRTPSLFRR